MLLRSPLNNISDADISNHLANRITDLYLNSLFIYDGKHCYHKVFSYQEPQVWCFYNKDPETILVYL